MTLRVAYLTGARWRGGALDTNGLPGPETPTFDLLRAASEGSISFEITRWDDPALLANPPNAALIRSCWDYPERIDAFLERLEAIEAAGVRLINAAGIVRWNVRKTYLRDLASLGVETIPTIFVDVCDARAVLRAFDTFDAAELVIKPQIGAGSRNTLRAQRNRWSEMDLAQAPSGPTLLQPYLPAIEADGERSLFFFGGRYSYAVRKRPAAGSWLANRADADFARYDPTDAELRLAVQAVAAAPAGLVYARVDLVTGGIGAPALIELEAIEPQLFLRLAPERAGDFVGALLAALSSGPGVLGR